MKALCLDTETTGLVFNRSLALNQLPEIIEFYGVLVNLAHNNGRKIKDYEALIKPNKYPISAEIIKETKTKLTNEMLLDAPTFKQVAAIIKKLIEEAPVVIGHNISFDKEILDIEFERLGMQIKWPHIICTVEQTIHLRGYRLSLTNLYNELFEEGFEDAHRARSDVKALTRCCVELFKRDIIGV